MLKSIPISVFDFYINVRDWINQHSLYAIVNRKNKILNF